MKTTITEFVHDEVFDGPIPAKAVAVDLGKPYSTLQNELTNYGNAKLGVETWHAIARKTGATGSIKFMVNDLGLALVDLRKLAQGAAENGRNKDALAAGLQAAKEFGEFCGQLHQALADNTIDKRELARIQAEGWEAIQAILLAMFAAKEQS